MRSVYKASNHVIWKIETFIEEDTRYKKHCTQDNGASFPFKVAPLDITQFKSSSAALSYFPEPHQQSKISSLLKVILVLRKARSLDCRGAKSLGSFVVLPKNLCMRHDAWTGVLLWWSCQPPVAHSGGLLNHPNSFCRGMFKLNAKFDADSLLYSLSHFKCDGHTVHMLTQQHRWPPLSSTVK